MPRVKRWLGKLDTPFEYLGLLFLLAMVLIVTWQVFSRRVLGTTPFWAQESSLVLMVWIGFIGIAIGFRERLHISIEIIVSRFPEVLRRAVEKAIQVLVLAFGAYLLVQGGQFTLATLGSTLPATGLPRSTLYVMMPVAGFMICVYSLLQMLGVRTEKHEEHSERGEADTPVERHAQ